MRTSSFAARGRFATMAAALLIFLGISIGDAEAQEGAIQGQVVDAQSLEPVAGAQVFIPNTGLGDIVDDDGTYSIRDVPAGEATVRVRLIGYESATRTVTVNAGQTTTADFELEQSTFQLQELVVTGVSSATPKAKLPFTVESLNTDDVPVPASDPISLLAGKGSGIQVVRGSGKPGTSSSVQLRGVTSINAQGRSNEPLIIIDGVVQGESSSLADINTLDIQNMEVVKGAAAASIYGSRAANGVINITTKKAENVGEGTFELTVRNEYGRSWLAGSIPLARNHPYLLNDSGNAFLLGSGEESADYTADGSDVVLDEEYGGTSPTPFRTFQDNSWPGQTYDNLSRFFEPGDTYSNYAAFSGRLQSTNFRGSFENNRELGVVDSHDGFKRRNARLNLQTSLAQDLDLTATAFYSHSNQDEIGGNPFFSLTFMSAGADLLREDEDGELVINPDPKAQEPNPIYVVRNLDNTDVRDRFSGSLSADYDLTGWLNLESTLSFDRSELNRSEFEPIGFKDPDNPEGGPGNAYRSNFWERSINGFLTASTGQTFLEDDLTTRLRVRYLFEDQQREFVRGSGSDFAVNDVRSLRALTQSISVNSYEQVERSEAVFLAGSVDYLGKYIFDGLVRRDGSSLFGPNEKWHTYGRASLAYRLSEEGWWPLSGSVDEFKLRGSYGTAGGRPSYAAQYETFALGSGGSVSPDQLGNRNLKPEFAEEIEAGVEMVLWDAAAVNVTYATSTVEDQLLPVPLPAYAGFSTQWRNAGTVESDTWEVGVQATLMERENASWSVRLSGDHINQVMTKLDVPPFKWGPQNRFYYREGEELGNFYGARWATSCSDLPAGTSCDQFQVNDDGYLVYVGGNSFRDGLAEQLWGSTGTVDGETYNWGIPFVAADGEFTNIGNNQPDFNLNFTNTFQWKGLSLYTLLAGSFDYELYNQTQQWAIRENKSGQQDQSGKPEGLKKPIGYYQTLYNVNASNSHFVEDGTFVKLRELSLGYNIPTSFVRDLFGGAIKGANISLIGRNLLTITDYTGYDPEVGVSGSVGGSAAVGRIDAYQYPNFPSLTGSVELTF